jgi:hypothetical protein
MLKKCKWYQFHKWEYVYDSYKDKFLGEECEKFYTKYRMCSKCDIIQSHELLGFVETGWRELSECETEILKSKIEPVFENGKTNWYFK